MKAIVLTYDKSHVFTDHMIASYNKYWTDHRFQFYIPYQEEKQGLQSKYGDLCRFIRTPKSIKKTILSLLDRIPDWEVVYFCIDDKYIANCDANFLNLFHNWVAAKSTMDQNFKGACFYRGFHFMQKQNLDNSDVIFGPGGEKLFRRNTYHHIWIHQYLRTGILRSLFESFPDDDFIARAMDEYIGQNSKRRSPMRFQSEERVYVTDKNHVNFGESTWHGKVTKNCADSMRRQGFQIPDNFLPEERSVFYPRRAVPGGPVIQEVPGV